MIYLVILIFLIYCSKNYDFTSSSINKSPDKVYIFTAIIFILLAGLRFYVGGDTHNYCRYFYESSAIKDVIKDSQNSSFQPGWQLLNSLVYTTTGNFVFLQIIVALFANFTIFRFIKIYSSACYVALISYFILNYFEFNMEIMREVVAISFGLLYFEKQYEKKWIPSIIYLVLAFLFHKSAAILLFFPLLNKIQLSKKGIFIAIIISTVGVVLFTIFPQISFIMEYLTAGDERLLHYVNQNFNDDLNVFYYISMYVIYMIIPLFMLVKTKGTYKYVGYIYLFIILHIFGIFSYAFYRFSNYIAPFYWLLIAQYTSVLMQKKVIRKFPILICLVIVMLFFYQRGQLKKTLFGNAQYERYYPYEMVNQTEHNYSLHQSKYDWRNSDY